MLLLTAIATRFLNYPACGNACGFSLQTFKCFLLRLFRKRFPGADSLKVGVERLQRGGRRVAAGTLAGRRHRELNGPAFAGAASHRYEGRSIGSVDFEFPAQLIVDVVEGNTIILPIIRNFRHR